MPERQIGITFIYFSEFFQVLVYDFAKTSNRPQPVIGEVVTFAFVNYPTSYSIQVAVKHGMIALTIGSIK